MFYGGTKGNFRKDGGGNRMSLAKIVTIIINAETKIRDMKKRTSDSYVQSVDEKDIKCQAFDKIKLFLTEEES